ncbi:MAG TPA: hypothetical protein VF711_00225 [Acidimicrobiales bacterium]
MSRLAAAVVVVLSSLGVVGTAPALAAPSSGAKFVVLNSLPESGRDSGIKINSRSQVVGITVLPPFSVNNYRATLWKASKTAVDLGSVLGDTSAANDINSGGTIVGRASTYYGGRAVIWDAASHTPTVLPAPGGPANSGANAEARGVNTTGLVAGWAAPGTSTSSSHAVVWNPAAGSVSDIGTLCGEGQPWVDGSAASDINDSGYVVGRSNACTGYGSHAFVWNPNTNVMTDISGGAVQSEANAVNGAGQVVGYRYDASFSCSSPFIWDPVTGVTTVIDVGCVEDGAAFDINGKGQVVGRARGQAIFWSPTAGLVYLNQFLPAGWTAWDAYGINDKGEITGTAVDIDFRIHAYVLTLPRAYR